MPWNNGPLTIYHGCDDVYANSILIPNPPWAHGVNLAVGRQSTDFGQVFYTTTNLHQAKNWANGRAKRLRHLVPRRIATVLSFTIDRDQLANRNILCFVTEGLGVRS